MSGANADMTPTLAEAVAQARADMASMPQILAQLELISHGGTHRMDRHATSLGALSPLLRVDEEPYPHDHFREAWTAASTARERAEVLAAARAELERLRKTPPPPEGLVERGTFHWWMRIASDFETPIGELARVNEVSRQAIARWRKRYGLEGPAERGLG